MAASTGWSSLFPSKDWGRLGSDGSCVDSMGKYRGSVDSMNSMRGSVGD